MKHLLFLFAIFFSQNITYSQPKIDKITWIGENGEYLSITKKKAFVQKKEACRELSVVKYVKNRYFVLSQTHLGEEFQVKYNIERFTIDTLILTPEGEDIFTLSVTNEKNQIVFVNSRMPNYQFVEFYFESLFNNFDNPKDKLKFILYVDSSKRSRVVVYNESYKEGCVYTAPPSKVEYENLLKILSSCDISSIPNDDKEIDKESSYQILEVSYNDRIKRFIGNTSLPVHFADRLTQFISDYIEMRVNINMPFGWRAIVRQRR